MFKRVLYEQWTDIVPIVAFVLTFTVFLVFTIRAFLMKKDRADAMAHLPISDPETQSSSRSASSHE